MALIGLRGGSGVWVNAELVRAIKTESAEAMAHWFGVSSTTVWAWRKAFGVGGFTKTRGTREAHHRASLAGGAKVRDEPLPAERVEQMREHAKKGGRKLPVRWTPERGGWTAEQLAMLGTEPDEVIAARIGRSAHAVRLKRGGWDASSRTIGEAMQRGGWGEVCLG